MAFFDWDDRYSVGVAQIDAQHRRLIEMINCLYEGMQRRGGADALAAALDEMTTLAVVIEELIAYCMYHFSTEESLMSRYAYPDSPSHRDAHAELTDRVHTFQRDFDAGKAVSSADLAQALQAWLTDHILHTDMQLGRFLTEKGVCSTPRAERAA